MASPSARRVANSLAATTSQCLSRLRNYNRSALVDSVLRRPPPPPPPPPSAAAFGASPDHGNNFGVGELFPSRQSGIAEFGPFVPFRKTLNFSPSVSLHGWGAHNNVSSSQQFIAAGGLLHQQQQVRKIFVEVKGNDLDRALRKWRRKCKEENLKALKEREYFKKPSEKRVLALKERDRRIARRSFKMKLNWILGRRQRGF